MKVLETSRLVVEQLTPADTAFILELLNDAGFIRNIGDRGVRDAEGALRYISGPIASYAKHGYGLYRVGLKPGGEAIGLCGLVRRDTLDHPDLGFAFLEKYRRQGYAREAAIAMRDHARDQLGLKELLAITTPDNYDSLKVLLALGFRSEDLVKLGDSTEELRLLRWEA